MKNKSERLRFIRTGQAGEHVLVQRSAMPTTCKVSQDPGWRPRRWAHTPAPPSGRAINLRCFPYTGI